MTRKHFVALAAIVHDGYRTAAASDAATEVVMDIEQALARFCAEQNSNFDVDRFQQACMGR